MKTIYDVYFAVSHCFINMFHLQQSQGILDSFFAQIWDVPRIRSRQFLFIWSEKSFLPFKLDTTYPQKKPNHKKSHANLIDSQYSTCLLKKCPPLQCICHVKCLTSSFVWWLIFLVSSPSAMTTLRFLHSSSINTALSKSSQLPMSTFWVPTIFCERSLRDFIL